MKIEKVEMLVANLHDKIEYVIHIRNLKQALNHGLVLKKFRVIDFNQKAWLKPYIWYEHQAKKKSKKITSRGAFSGWWVIKFLEKLWKKGRKKEILNL